MSEKMVNYTPEQVAEVVEKYRAGIAVEQIAMDVGKSVRSIVAKLSREGVYQAKTRVAVNRVTKSELVEAIARYCDRPSEVMESLEKANQEVLNILYQRLQQN